MVNCLLCAGGARSWSWAIKSSAIATLKHSFMQWVTPASLNRQSAFESRMALHQLTTAPATHCLSLSSTVVPRILELCSQEPNDLMTATSRGQINMNSCRRSQTRHCRMEGMGLRADLIAPLRLEVCVTRRTLLCRGRPSGLKKRSVATCMWSTSYSNFMVSSFCI